MKCTACCNALEKVEASKTMDLLFDTSMNFKIFYDHNKEIGIKKIALLFLGLGQH